MELKDNPLLQQEDYRAGYKESIENLKNRPELVQLDKMCYELFYMNELGKKFLEYITERYLIPPMADRNGANFPTNAVWGEGFKDFIRMIRHAAMAHEQRIKAETNK